MAKVIVIYDQPKDIEGFDQYYREVHIPLVQHVPNLKGAEVNRVLQALNSNDQPYLIAELVFDNPQELTQALASPEGQTLQNDIANLMPFLNKPPVITITD
jgi:uncharacterized protein (TIGR02118 family)